MNVWKVIIACHFNAVRIFLEVTIALWLTFFIAGIAIFVQVFWKELKGYLSVPHPRQLNTGATPFQPQNASVLCVELTLLLCWTHAFSKIFWRCHLWFKRREILKNWLWKLFIIGFRMFFNPSPPFCEILCPIFKFFNIIPMQIVNRSIMKKWPTNYWSFFGNNFCQLF